MRIETVKCDQCGAVKGESNHWLHMDVATNRDGNIIYVSIGRAKTEQGFERMDLCGQECFHKILDALLFTQKPSS